MTRLTKIVIKAFILVMILAVSIPSIMAQSTAAIRFVHVIPDAVPVDVYVNGTLAVKNLDYGDASNYINVPTGEHTIIATAAGLTSPLWEQIVNISEASQTTFIASNAASPQFAAFGDNLSATAFGTSRLAIIHALAGGSNVSVQLAESVTLGDAVQDAGTSIVPEIGYGEKFGEFDLPVQTYVVDILPVGETDAILSNIALSLTSNTSYMALVYGTESNPDVLLLSARTNPDLEGGLVRFVNGVVGGPTVDVVIDDTLIAAGLTPTNPTHHISLPAGEHDVVFVEAGTEDAIGSTTLSIEGFGAQTIAALVVDDESTISTFEDNIFALDATHAGGSVLNTIDGSTVTVELPDGTLIGEAESGEQSDVTVFDPVVAATSFTINVDGDEGTLEGDDTVFYGGVYYHFIVLDGSAFGAPSILIADSNISQTLAAAPGADEATLVTGDEAPPTEETTVPDTSSEVTSSEVQPLATTAPVVNQSVTIPDDAIVGEVALDPSANLNLRQFPNANALVLGQAPSGSQLTILGREGAPVALVEGDPPPPEAETFVDPVELLGEGQDLDSTQTWVRVIYNTPDGGEIEAWTLSQYLIISDNEGLLDLRDLEMTPSNIPGEARNTDVTPPPEPEDIITVEVININAGAGLNIRRNPSSQGEVLGQLTLGTVVQLNGLLTSDTGLLSDSEWAFIAYTPSEGGVITGWINTAFITYLWNGEDADLAELIDRGLINEVAEDLIGEVGARTVPVTAATPDPERDAYVAEIALDLGANLNLRRTPDVQGEVLVQIPSGTFVIVSARTADAEWLATSYEGEDGWIASQFVIVTYNGQFIADLTEIPVDTTVGAGALPETTETP